MPATVPRAVDTEVVATAVEDTVEVMAVAAAAAAAAADRPVTLAGAMVTCPATAPRAKSATIV